MSRGRTPDPRKEQFWRDHLARWQQSGLSVRAYCHRHHLAVPSFYAWRRTLQRRPAAPAAALPFVALPLPARAPGRLEVLLPNGRRLRFPPTLDAVRLRQLLAVLEERPC